MDAKLANYLRERIAGLQARAKDIMFSYQCEDEDTDKLLEEVMAYIEDVDDLLHHIAIV
jgi:hypothetical protein